MDIVSVGVPSGSRWQIQNRMILGGFVYNGAIYKGPDNSSQVVISSGWKEWGEGRGYQNPGEEREVQKADRPLTEQLAQGNLTLKG